MTPQKVFKTCNFKKMCPFGHGKTSGDMVGSCMPKSGPGGCPRTRVMTIFGSHVDPHIPNIGYMRVYEGLHALGGISSFQAQISSRMHSK